MARSGRPNTRSNNRAEDMRRSRLRHPVVRQLISISNMTEPARAFAGTAPSTERNIRRSSSSRKIASLQRPPALSGITGAKPDRTGCASSPSHAPSPDKARRETECGPVSRGAKLSNFRNLHHETPAPFHHELTSISNAARSVRHHQVSRTSDRSRFESGPAHASASQSNG